MMTQTHTPKLRHVMGVDHLHLHVGHEWQRADANSLCTLAPAQAAQRMGLRDDEDCAWNEQHATSMA